jgi:hypothetical protein
VRSVGSANAGPSARRGRAIGHRPENGIELSNPRREQRQPPLLAYAGMELAFLSPPTQAAKFAT